MTPEAIMQLISGGSQAVGNLASLPFNVYGDLEQLKLGRRGIREQERGGKFNRLMSLMNASEQGSANRAGQNRLFQLRGGQPGGI